MRLKFNQGLSIINLLALLFTCWNCSTEITGPLIDARDNQIYKTVIIGEQCWMAENLKFLPHVNPPDSDSGIYVYDYNSNDVNEARQTFNFQTYGVLYNWATAMGLPNQYNTIDWEGTDILHQGICPDGWHLPSDSEWYKLESFILTNLHVDDSANIALKIKSDTLWLNNGNGTNETGFSALPSGFRFREGFFDKIGRYGYFWTSTQCPSSCEQSASYRYLIFSDNEIHKSYPSKKSGLPVRCVKD